MSNKVDIITEKIVKSTKYEKEENVVSLPERERWVESSKKQNLEY